MLVVVGLHNPGARYQATRHNLGAEVVDELANQWNSPFRRGPLRVRCDVAQTKVRAQDVVLARPRSAMNLAGGPVQALLRYYRVAPQDLLVCHDDIDLPFARLRLQFGRGSGGHNGVESIVSTLGTKDFHRLKLGVGRPPGGMDPATFVLRPFTKAERAEIDLLVRDGAEVVDRFVDDPEAAMRMAAERSR